MRRGKLPIVAAALATLGAIPVALWIGIHKTSWLGPLLADTTRAIAGPEFVARGEDAAYDAEDRWNRWWHEGDAPKTLWPVPVTSGTCLSAAPSGASASAARLAFPPASVDPLLPDRAAQGDGAWVPMPDPRAPNDPPRMHKTLLHPDGHRPWTAVAIVAIDLTSVQVHLEAGRYVPEPTEPEARSMPRPGVVPSEHLPLLLAAFNGGFKTIHGRLGMHLRGITIVAPQPWACTVARMKDGRIVIDTWDSLPGAPGDRLWWRQTPPCLIANGEIAEGVNDATQNWGSGVGGRTFIRRSAIGINPGGTVLFVGIGDAVSAAGIARAMRHVGAVTAAQLDVNWSLPKFLVFEPDRLRPGNLIPKPLYEGLSCSEDEYLREPSSRDFFYLTRLPQEP